jgi:DTW domain-containing protein YfiP
VVTHRTKSKARCPRCLIGLVLCVCEFIPQINLATKVILLIHKRETRRPTNTGRLLTLTLPHSELRVRGEKGQPMEERGLVTADRETLLFYPSDEALELNAETLVKFKRPLTLVVPDGSWRQAGKMMNRVEALQGVTHVKLPAGPTPRLRLRKESKVGGLSTFEAVTRAIGIIEGLSFQMELEEFYKIYTERTLWSRAKLLLKDCETGIPRAALFR